MRTYLLPTSGTGETGIAVASRFLNQRFAVDPLLMEPLPVPDEAHDTVREQYDATIIMRAALTACPDDADRLVVLTDHDIFIPMLTFIFGQAQLDGAVSLVSLARLRQEFYGLPPREDLLQQRLRKELHHELGHTFGLTHCADNLCVMALSVNVAGIDIKREEACGSCANLMTTKLYELRRRGGAQRRQP